MCSRAEEYTWSRDKYYLHLEFKTFVDTDILLSISKNKVAAVPEYIRLMEIPEPKEYIDVAKTPLIPQEITLLVEKELRQAGIDDMRDQGAREALAKVVHILYEKHGLSMRKIAGELGISKSSVQNIISGK
jgi:DNA-directed RNA polymerase specialized sigma subunit